MDPLDRKGAVQEPKTAKEARSYVPIPWEPERWDIGLPAELDLMMARRGVGIYPSVELGPTEVPFYKWANREGLWKSIAEADRAIAAGAMEYVPAHRLSEVLECSTIHPWTIVDQGGGKWRLCHDYSVGTNKHVPTASFVLPSVWDVAPVVTEGSYFAKYDIRDGFWHVPVGEDSKKRLVVRHPGTGRLIWASRLPFGYVESPRLFCGLTEAVISRLRRQAAGRGIHFYVFVDDALVVGDTEELTREGMSMLEEEFAARGLEWAPHKKRGPCQCLEFLGLLLCNFEGLRGVTLTEKRLGKLLTEMELWESRREQHGPTEAEPRELASLLGKLVFASQVVAGGRQYMQGMLSQFKGLIVDWRRGSVSFSGGPAQRLTLSDGFFRDLAWWRDHLAYRSLASFSGAPRRAEAVITGTDASGWGTGQVIWLDGAREESHLRFTAAEKRRPINWRELLGVLRVCELGGERLRGKVVLIETDNMAAKDSARRMSSKAEDMQELTRRLYAEAEAHGFSVRVTHTPGEKLDRPDQTSRGDAAEEPRARLRKSLFEGLEARWGRFESFLGAERELASEGSSSAARGVPTAWAHPTISTVGTALRRLQERMVSSMGGHARALALVPDDDSAPWSKLMKHGMVIGRLPAGSPAIDMNVLGQWRPADVLRPARLVVFPRSAGVGVRRVMLSLSEGARPMVVPGPRGGQRQTVAGEGYMETADGTGLRLPVFPGSFVYSLPAEGGFGGLYMVLDSEAGGLYGDPDDLVGLYALRLSGKAVSRLRTALPVVEVDHRGEVFRPDPRELWVVDHLVSDLGSSAGGMLAKFTFDFEAANAQIRGAGGAWSSDSNGWVLLSPDSEEPSPGSARRMPSSYSPYAPTPEALGERLEGAGVEGELREVELELDRLHLAQSAVKTGSEGRVPQREFYTRGGEPAGVAGGATQRNQYAGMLCGGCGQELGLGVEVLSHGNSLVHMGGDCSRLLDERLAGEAERETQAQQGATVYYGVYSDEVGASAVYTDWDEVARLVSEEARTMHHASFKPCGTMAEAHDFVKEATLARATGAAIDLTIKGSLVRRVHLSEKLSAARLDLIQKCVAGNCGHARDDGSLTMCRGGCGRGLHVELCGQLGRGYAALGNFTCADCRLVMLTDDPQAASEKLRHTALCTSVLELGQGRETTAASYADFTRLEEAYVLGMGHVLDGALRLPRHNAECFKNFMSWMVLDKDRARSLISVVRAAGAFMTKLKIPDVTKMGDVKSHLKELCQECGLESEPATAATPRMMSLLLADGGVIDSRFSDAFIAGREKVQIVLEGVGGCRICEVAGDCHGVLANNTCILEDLEAEHGALGGVVAEALLEHSKTGFRRFLDMAGTTVNTKIEVAKTLRRYWSLAGWTEANGMITTTVKAGVKITRPDVWVVRVSLLGLDDPGFRRLISSLNSLMPTAWVQRHARGVELAAKRRWMASGSGSQEKKYVNVAMMAGSDKGLDETVARFIEKGFTAAKVPGPLLLSTSGGKYPVIQLQPYSVGSAFKPTKELLERAHALANQDPLDPDPDLDTDPRRECRWTTHSLRRLADTVARRYRQESGATEAQIDIYFGWQERLLLKAMQVHYASLSIRERMLLAIITGYM